MNLIEITEQLKNPAVSVQQLMQYANNSNPQVPSYVALAEMQRRQSMQAPPQVPQQTVKDQLGASLMGLPAAPVLHRSKHRNNLRSKHRNNPAGNAAAGNAAATTANATAQTCVANATGDATRNGRWWSCDYPFKHAP